jgi:hypothetical protein
MKKINIIYWIATVLIMLFLLSSVIGSFTNNPKGAAIMAQLGYKPYIIKALAIAKAVGIIVLLIPGWPRLKEWVYAGFAYDLIGATFSMIAVGMAAKNWAIMPVFIIILAVSYIYHHKRLKLKATATKDATV